MSTTSQPPAPSRWAMEAADAILLPRTRRTHPDPDTDEELRREDIAAIIQRHHAAAQAETVALLEEAVALLNEGEPEPVSLDDKRSWEEIHNNDYWKRHEDLMARIRAQLKGGAP